MEPDAHTSTSPPTIRRDRLLFVVAVAVAVVLQWPNLSTLVMFPLLVVMYVRLAFREVADMEKELGGEYRAYRRRTSAFIPRLKRARATPPMTGPAVAGGAHGA
ncbi:MAG: hypothetical protein AB2A00_04075 [Myxococcota bacterium]